MTHTRDELIGRLRAMQISPLAAIDIADFVLPLLAAERERAIEECCHWLRTNADENDKSAEKWRKSMEYTLAEQQAAAASGFRRIAKELEIRALRAPTDKPEPAPVLETGTQPARVTQAPALSSQPAASDWADAIARDYWAQPEPGDVTVELAALLRERFGPCVEALEKIEEMEYRSHDATLGTIHYLAYTALARLRGEKENA